MIAGAMIVLAAAAALFVLAPLRRSAHRPGYPAEQDRLFAEREALLQALRDLDLDRATGKLSDADYAGLAARYRAQAIAVLGRLDALPGRACGVSQYAREPVRPDGGPG